MELVVIFNALGNGFKDCNLKKNNSLRVRGFCHSQNSIQAGSKLSKEAFSSLR